jgi:hypothetical protein
VIAGSHAGGVGNPAATSTGVGGSGGDARGGVAGGTGAAPAAGGPSAPGPAADLTAGGPATPAGRGACDDVGSTGVTGMGSGALGHPSGATAGDAGGRDVPLSGADRAQGVTSAREVGVVGNAGLAREAGLPGSSVGPSGQAGRDGSGSTTDEPGGRETLTDGSSGTVGGSQGQGIGGPAPTSAPEVQAGVRGAGARDGERKDEA